MRLIDADALDMRERGNNSQRVMWWEIEKLLRQAPTIDVEPIKHGHWIKEKYERPICSVCGNQGFLSIIDSITGDFPYCAWCGAKMDEDVTEK